MLRVDNATKPGDDRLALDGEPTPGNSVENKTVPVIVKAVRGSSNTNEIWIRASLMRKMIALGSVLFAGACGSYDPARVVVMQNPETKQTVECRVDPWGHVNRKLQIDSCVSAYEQAGYKKVGDSNAQP